MRWRSRVRALVACVAVSGAAHGASHARLDDSPRLVHAQRFAMGTMFDAFAWHGSTAEARLAIDEALREIERLDRVMSHFRVDSDLSRVNSAGAGDYVSVDSALVDVVSASLVLSERTGGRFDITMTPLLKLWREAREKDSAPDAAHLDAARACVGAAHVDVAPPDRIRLRSSCTELDLSGVGKGFAVDRALSVLVARGITSALINAGGSSIGAIGAPPGKDGWPVRLGAAISGHGEVLLRDASMSTSRGRAPGRASPDGIVDPRTGALLDGVGSVSVIAPDGTTAEALSKALLMATDPVSRDWLSTFPQTAAIWIAPDSTLAATWRVSELRFADAP